MNLNAKMKTEIFTIMIKVMVGLSAGLLRCGKSCRLRWTNYLRPDLKRGLLSEYEEQMVIDLHAQLGNRYLFLIYLPLWHYPSSSSTFPLSWLMCSEFNLFWVLNLERVVFCITIFPVYAASQMVFYIILFNTNGRLCRCIIFFRWYVLVPKM